MGKKRIPDPVMGRLEWDYLWEGTSAAKVLTNGGKLFVDSDDGSPPSEEQRQAYSTFLATERELVPKVEKALFDYYNRVKKNYRDALPHGAKRVPELKKSSGIWKLLGSSAVTVPRQRKGEIAVDLSWNCSWDSEHGVVVKLRKGKVVDVGLD